MQLHSTNRQSVQVSEGFIHPASVLPSMTYPMTEDSSCSVTDPDQFCTRYIDSMELYADTQTVAAYFDDHSAWFRRCAHPMKAESLGKYGYALTIGQFGAFGYEIEPKIGLDLLPQQEGIYRIETIAVPGYEPPGYDVDFKAAMELVPTTPEEWLLRELKPHGIEQITRIQWDLDLKVKINFPRFIYALPQSLIQTTGDRLLAQIVRQVSHRLNRKVQADFSETHGVPMPKRPRRWFFQKQEPTGEELIDLDEE